jgi:excisionase family DNA binding protein
MKERLDKLAEDIKKLPPERIERLEKVVNSMANRQAVSLKEAAEILGVSIQTLRRAIRSGDLKAFQIVKAGNWKVPIDEIERLMKKEPRT